MAAEPGVTDSYALKVLELGDGSWGGTSQVRKIAEYHGFQVVEIANARGYLEWLVAKRRIEICDVAIRVAFYSPTIRATSPEFPGTHQLIWIA